MKTIEALALVNNQGLVNNFNFTDAWQPSETTTSATTTNDATPMSADDLFVRSSPKRSPKNKNPICLKTNK